MTILEELRGAAVNAAKFSVHRELFHDPTPTYVAARFYAAHRRFIRSDNFFLPAAVSLLFLSAGLRGLGCTCAPFPRRTLLLNIGDFLVDPPTVRIQRLRVPLSSKRRIASGVSAGNRRQGRSGDWIFPPQRWAVGRVAGTFAK